MIGREFGDFDSMVFNHCNAIHTLFMGIRLDVIFLDRENKICKLEEGLKPWKLMVRSGRAYSVIEMPCGTIEKTGTELGDVLDLNATMTREMENKIKGKDIINMGPAIPFKESER